MKYLKIIYFISLPTFYIIYLCYMRLIRIRIPRDIDIFISPMMPYIISFILIGLCLRIYFLLKADNIIKPKESKNKFIIKIKELLKEIAKHMTEIRTQIIRIISIFRNYDDFLLGWIQYFYLNLPSKKMTCVIIIFELLPKIILILIFLIDVVYFKQISYFYKFLGLLLLPLIPSFIIAMIHDYYIFNIKEIIRLLDSRPIAGTEYDDFCFYNPREVPEFISDLDSYINYHFYPIYYIPIQVAYVKDIRDDNFFNKINIMICFIYIILWIYILVVGLGIIKI